MPRRRYIPRGKAPKKKFNIPYLDPGIPNAPYLDGARLTVQKHEPLPPFGNGYKNKHRRGEAVLAQMRTEQLPQSVYCLDNQPPGPDPAEDAPTVEIEIVEPLRSHLTPGAHLMSCKILSGTLPTNTQSAPVSSASSTTETASAAPPTSPPPALVVAKFFDPLYYDHTGDFDIVDMADMEYGREAAAYEHLIREGMDGKLLPAYYGSYSLELPLTERQMEYFAQYKGADHPLLQVPNPVRRVRLILMEKVEGESMVKHLSFGNVNGLTDEGRLDVIASTLEAYARLYFHGIAHGDLAPRNIFLKDEAEGNGDPANSDDRKIKDTKLRFTRFVDLGLAYILGHPESAFPRQSADEMRPRNPIRLFWHVFESGAVNMYHWLPPNLRNTESFQLWMLQRWYGDTRFESVGAVPIPVKNDDDWKNGLALTNETWPTSNGDDLRRGDGDKDDDGTGKRGWQLPSALARAVAAIPGIRALSIALKEKKCAVPDDKTVDAVRDASNMQPPQSSNAFSVTPLELPGQYERPKGFW